MFLKVALLLTLQVFAMPLSVKNGINRPILEGRHKWLGGVMIDGSVYAVPSHARHVLCLDIARRQFTPIARDSGELEGKFKWLRGQVMKDGENGGSLCFYCIPAHSETILKVQPSENKVRHIAIPHGLGEGEWKWHGSAAVDDYIYTIPANAEHVLQICTADDSVSALPSETGQPFIGKNKWYGGIAARGRVYGVPYTSESVLCVVSTTVLRTIHLFIYIFPVLFSASGSARRFRWWRNRAHIWLFPS